MATSDVQGAAGGGGGSGSGGPVMWQKDSDARVCTACKKEFTTRKRKHHCRCALSRPRPLLLTNTHTHSLTLYTCVLFVGVVE